MAWCIGTTEGFWQPDPGAPAGPVCAGPPGLVVDLLALPGWCTCRAAGGHRHLAGAPGARRGGGCQLTDYVLQLYGARSYLQRHAPIHTPDDLRGHTFISYVDDLLFSKELQILDELHRPRISRCAAGPVQAAREGLAPALWRRKTCRWCLCCRVARFQRTFWMSCPATTNTWPMQATWAFCGRRWRRGKGCCCRLSMAFDLLFNFYWRMIYWFQVQVQH